MGAQSRIWNCIVRYAGRVTNLGRTSVAASSPTLIYKVCGVVDQISDADNLWRKFRLSINHCVWSDELQQWMPSDKALQFDDDGMSTMWAEHLEKRHEYVPIRLIEDEYNSVGQFEVFRLRNIGFVVSHTPEDSEPTGCAHSSVSWPTGLVEAGASRPNKDDRKLLRSEIRRVMSWIVGDAQSRKRELDEDLI